MLRNFALAVLGLSLLSAAPVLADSTPPDSFTFTSALGNLGPSATITNGGLSLSAAGFSAPGVSADLFSKNQGADETGLGLAAGTDWEIMGKGFVQLDLQNILSKNPSAITLVMSSVTGDDKFDIWGSNTAGTPGTLLLSNQTGSNVTLPDLGQFRFVFISAPSGNVLLNAVNVDVPTGGSGGSGPQGVPEPSSAAMLLLGLAGLAGLTRLAKRA